MATLRSSPAPLSILLFTAVLSSGCTGGSESNAAVENAPGREAPQASDPVNAKKELASISDAIPVYHGAEYREDLTRRDVINARTRYGKDARVITMATDDSFPQVYHYYTTYLAQYRGFPAQETYPGSQKNWRTLEVHLNQAMQDPFATGSTLPLNGPQVIMQVAETEAEPRTVIRYIVTPAASAPPPPVIAENGTPSPAPAPTPVVAENELPVEPVAR